MIAVDRKPGVRLVIDREQPPKNQTKSAQDLAPGDVIAVPFGGYGDLLAEVYNVHQRDDLLDVSVKAPRPGVQVKPFDHTTVLRADASVLVYPADQVGTWRS